MLDNLTRDALAADAAGMSYGKWKALHPNTKPKKERPSRYDSSKIYRECRVCGRKFEVKYPHHQMCSDDCRSIHARLYNREVQRKIREQRVENKED